MQDSPKHPSPLSRPERLPLSSARAFTSISSDRWTFPVPGLAAQLLEPDSWDVLVCPLAVGGRSAAWTTPRRASRSSNLDPSMRPSREQPYGGHRLARSATLSSRSRRSASGLSRHSTDTRTWGWTSSRATSGDGHASSANRPGQWSHRRSAYSSRVSSRASMTPAGRSVHRPPCAPRRRRARSRRCARSSATRMAWRMPWRCCGEASPRPTARVVPCTPVSCP